MDLSDEKEKTVNQDSLVLFVVHILAFLIWGKTMKKGH